MSSAAIMIAYRETVGRVIIRRLSLVGAGDERIFYRIFFRIVRDRPLRSVTAEQLLSAKAQVSRLIDP